MKMTFRWYGKTDPVSLEYISQIPGMTGVVTAIYDIPVGEVWPLDKITELKEEVNAKNLEMKVIESVPVHEDIKMGLPSREKYIENYKYITLYFKFGNIFLKLYTLNFMHAYKLYKNKAHRLC